MAGAPSAVENVRTTERQSPDVRQVIPAISVASALGRSNCSRRPSATITSPSGQASGVVVVSVVGAAVVVGGWDDGVEVVVGVGGGDTVEREAVQELRKASAIPRRIVPAGYGRGALARPARARGYGRPDLVLNACLLTAGAIHSAGRQGTWSDAGTRRLGPCASRS